MNEEYNATYFDKIKKSFLDNKYVAYLILAFSAVGAILALSGHIIGIYNSINDEPIHSNEIIAKNKIRPIYFKSMSADLTEESKEQLDSYLPYLNDEDVEKIIVEGHTREVNPMSNIPLAMRRTSAVVFYLQKKGIPREIMELVPWGAERPIKEATSAYNDRVEIHLTRK